MIMLLQIRRVRSLASYLFKKGTYKDLTLSHKQHSAADDFEVIKANNIENYIRENIDIESL